MCALHSTAIPYLDLSLQTSDLLIAVRAAGLGFLELHIVRSTELTQASVECDQNPDGFPMD